MVSGLIKIVEEVAPIPGGRRKNLRNNILDLWRQLTSERAGRQMDYIGEPSMLAAYLRYFLPWNVVKFVSLLSELELDLKENACIMDLGSGPLTLPIALWIAKPELRVVPIKLLCTDRVSRVMETGKKLLETLAMRNNQSLLWEIELRKEGFSTKPTQKEEKYDLITGANVFNESFWKQKASLTERAEQLHLSLKRKLKENGSILLIEPGDPRSGTMLSALREAVILDGGNIMAPCTHLSACPMPGSFLSGTYRKKEEGIKGSDKAKPQLERVINAKGRSKAPWCHFSVDLGAAPKTLFDLSLEVGLPKTRLIASYLFFSPSKASPSTKDDKRQVRLISDSFKLPDGGFGRYACSKAGYTLARGSLADLASGSLAVLNKDIPKLKDTKQGYSNIDQKSGAIIISANFAKSPSAS